MIATGRQPNVDNLGLEAAGVNFHSRDGIYANEFLQTSNPDVYAVGDCLAMSHDGQVTGPGYQFTHNSDVHARIARMNALFDKKIDRRNVLLPWSTYTDPEIAHVGKYQ